jgi:AcrR family transcriptional regulator
MESVAERAGVGKATIYRRWSSKDELLKEAIASLSEDFAYVDTGSLLGDWRALLTLGAGGEAGAAVVRVVPQLLGEFTSHPDLHALFREQFVDSRRSVGREMLQAAQRRGELADDVDLELVLDMLVGPLVYRMLRLGTLDPAETAGAAGAVLDTLVRGIGPARGRRSARSR